MDILSSIGHTPLIELANLNHNQKVKAFAKVEGGNPGGSIKDREVLKFFFRPMEI